MAAGWLAYAQTAPIQNATLSNPTITSVTDIATPGVNPGAGLTKVYSKGGKWCALDPSGVETCTIATTQNLRVCDIVVGDTSGAALNDAQLGPQKRLCYIPAGGTIQEMVVEANAGTPNVIVGRNRAGSVSNIVSSALATAAAGATACAKTTSTTGIDGTACTGSLQNTGLNAGDRIELVSGTAGGTAKLMTIHVIYVTQ